MQELSSTGALRDKNQRAEMLVVSNDTMGRVQGSRVICRRRTGRLGTRILEHSTSTKALRNSQPKPDSKAQEAEQESKTKPRCEETREIHGHGPVPLPQPYFLSMYFGCSFATEPLTLELYCRHMLHTR